jgi:hypothetical protein
MSDGAASYIQAGPATPQGGCVDPVDLEDLAPARRAGDDADGQVRDVHRRGQQPGQRLVRGAVDRGRRDPDAKDSVEDAVDAVRAATGCEANGEAGRRAVPEGAASWGRRASVR